MKDISKTDLYKIVWTSDKLKEMREAIGVSQRDLAELIGISKGTISHIECDLVSNPLILIGYGTVLERVYANRCGYIPAYRKIGTNEFEENLYA